MEKYYNPKSKKIEPIFESLNPVFKVCCRTPNIVVGDKGCAVYFIVEARDEEDAKDKVMLNNEFTKHLNMKNFKRNMHLDVYRPTGLYVIGQVDYHEGDPRL
jgi:hypothetical protein